MAATMTVDERVVVAGAGFAGVGVAQALADEREVVLVAPQEEFVYLPMIHEVLSEISRPGDVTIPIEELVPEAEHVHGRAERVEGDELVTAAGQRLAFDRLVVAIGAQPADFGVEGASEHGLPMYSVGDAMRANAELKHAATEVEGPLEVTVVGASFTGVEVAGEVADLLDDHDVDRSVRLLEARDRIFPGQSAKFRQGVLDGLERLDIELHRGALVDRVGPEAIEASVDDDPRSWDSHVTFWCAGVEPRSIANVDQRVDPRLVSREREDVFVAGDAATFEDLDVPRLAQTAEDQADVVVHNVLNPHDPVAYRPNVRGLLVSIGARYAVAELSHGPVFTGRIPWHVKRNLYKAKMSLA
jgi:NADH dehydrogenase